MLSLTTSWRHRNDEEMARILHLLRNTVVAPGTPWPEELWRLVSRCRANADAALDADAVILVDTNNAARAVNEQKIAALPGDLCQFNGIDQRPGFDPIVRTSGDTEDASDQTAGLSRMDELIVGDIFSRSVLSALIAVPQLNAKIGMPVIANSSISSSVPNGTRGVIVGWRSATSIRDELELDDATLERRFNCTRREVEHLWPRIIEDCCWPEVEFKIERFNSLTNKVQVSRETMVVYPKKFVLTDQLDAEGEIASRIQIPLQCSFALTVHKSQASESLSLGA